MSNLITRLLWLLLALVLQVLLFNHLSLLGGLVFVYVIALLKMPLNINRSLQILIGFLAGYLVDVFCNTHGMHALAAGTMMFFRIPILTSIEKGKDLKTIEINFTGLDVSVYMRFMLTILVFFAVILYFIEAFTLFNFLVTLEKVVISVLLTWIFAVALENATTKR